jgi:hypothetical protein
MESFPDHIERVACKNKLTQNQKILTQTQREIFTNEIDNAITKCEKEVHLAFDKKLWPEHRVVIAKELLARFGQLKVHKVDKNYSDISKKASRNQEIPINIISITIEFVC